METKASRRHSEADMETLRTAAHHGKAVLKALRAVGYDGMRPKSVKALDESATLTERQVALYDMLEESVAEYGMFDRGIGANGAHYATAEQNPFKSEGIACKNCVFYEGGLCEIIAGDIEEDAVCKFWIIPESMLMPAVEEAPAEDVAAEEMAMVEDAVKSAAEPEEDAPEAVEEAPETVVLDNTATMNTEAAKSFARRLMGKK